VQTVTVAGQEAVAADAGWSSEEGEVAARYVVIHLGDRVVVIQNMGKEESGEAFAPTFEAMLDTVILFEPVAQTTLTQEYDGGDYAVLYPEGWETRSAGTTTFFFQSEEILEDEVPSVPVVVIDSGPLDTISSGELAGTGDAREMLVAFREARRAEGREFQMEEIEEINFGGDVGAMTSFLWIEDGVPAMDLAVAVHDGHWGILVQAIGTVKGWQTFAPVYGEMVESITLQEREPPGQVDFANPVSVLEAVFAAAQTGDFSVLPSLCDPLGQHDGDTALICAITEDHPDRDAFVAAFAKSKINGQPVINGDEVQIPFLFGPDGDQEETMTLILRDGKWYLSSF
jgi:hypothetical protein